jgi:aminopeptidase N
MKREFAFPGTRSHYAPDHACRVEHVRIEIDLDVDARRIRGRASLTLQPIDAPARPGDPARDPAPGAPGRPGAKPSPGHALTWLPLDAVELEIHAVASAGRALPFRHDGKVLRVDVSGVPLDERGQLTLDIDYAGSPRRGLYFVGPDHGYPDKPLQVWTQGQDEDSRFWFPCLDAPHAKATSEVIATVPARFTVLSNGTKVADQVDEAAGRRTVHWRFGTRHSCYLITLVAAELAEIRDRWRDLEVTYYVTPGREDEARRTLRRTPEMMELFSDRFGAPFPYERYAQVFVADFIFGGMENTTATTLTDQVLLDERAALDGDSEDLVAHELAHQWFGDLLTCREWSQSWLNEGFATYAEYVWREHAHGRDEAALELQDWAHEYFEEDTERYRRPIVTRLYDAPIDIFDRHLYEKGALVLHMLRQVLGDEPFWRSIARYVEDHRGDAVEIRDLARAIERATGRMLDWFFDQWLTDGAGHPELELGYTWDPERSLARVEVRQTQKVDQTTPLFRLPVRMRFRVPGRDARDVDVEFEITEASQIFFFALDQAPTQAIFDPGKHLLAEVKMDKGVDLWIAELAGATEAVDRMDAARALGKRGGSQATEALVTALGKDEFWGVRAASAEALGEIRSEQACEALVAAVGRIEHPKARRAMMKALGAFRGSERAADALLPVVERGDPSLFVEAEACLALGKTRSPRAAAALRGAVDRDSYRDLIRRHVYLGLAELRDDDAIELLREGATYGRVLGGRRAALEALAQLVRGRRDARARAVRELCEDLLRDPDFMVQLSAIHALDQIGDPAAIPALDALSARALDGRLRRRAREAIRDLREGRQATEEREALREELDRLRTRLIALEERMDADRARPAGPKGQPAGQTGARTRPESKPGARAQARPAAKAQARPGAKAQERPAAKAQARPAAKAQARPAAKAQARPAARVASNAQVRPEQAKARPKAKKDAKKDARRKAGDAAASGAEKGVETRKAASQKAGPRAGKKVREK